LSSIRRGDGEGVGSWFNDHLRQDVGGGVDTLFCWDPWLEGGILQDIFSFFLSL